MGNTVIFSNNTYLSVNLFSLAFLLLAVLYSGRAAALKNAVTLLFLGLLCTFGADFLEVKITDVYAEGRPIEAWVFIQLSLLLAAMILLAVAASRFVADKLPSLPLIAGIGLLGAAVIVYSTLIAPDGIMVNNMRKIFPLAAFCYLAVSFWSKPHNSGFITAAIVSSAAALCLIYKWFEPESINHLWYFPALLYLLLAASLMMMRLDITEANLDRSLAEVSKYNRRIEEIIKSSPFPIIISRLSDDKILLANNNAIKLFGIIPGEIERYKLRDFFADADNRRLLSERLEKEQEVQDFEILVKTPHIDTPFWLLASANIIDYNYDLVLYSAFQDITSRKNREVLLKNQAVRDPLTSLYNRRYFEEEVNKRILAAKQANDNFSILMIDADLFKNVNDTYGHKVGDKVLIELAATCERALRDDDIVARYGGEEFVIFLSKVNGKKAAMVAERLRETIAGIVVYSEENQPVRFTVSIGVSSDEISDNIDMLIKTADEALYRAKQNGRNRVDVFRKKDLEHFDREEPVHKDESASRHPVFDKEENREISLLDGPETKHLQDEDDYYPLPGVDEDDFR